MRFASISAVSAIALVALGNQAASQRLLKDIRLAPNAAASSNPDRFFRFNDILLFRASDGRTGPELWKTDGTPAGTVQVADVWPGGTGSGVGQFRQLGNIVLFGANSPGRGFELFKTDGTTAGTSLVLEIRAGATGSNPQNIVVFNGKAYFHADDGVNGRELWMTDGTSAGTTLVKDIRAGAAGSGVNQIRVVNGRLVFSADDGTNGREIYVSDGTSAGTVLLKDIEVGPTGSAAGRFFVSGSICYFVATTSSNGQELWKTDGTAAGTVLVKDINLGAPGSDSKNFIQMADGRVVFNADDGLNGKEPWITDGTAAGTLLLADVNPGAAPGSPNGGARAGDLAFFYCFTVGFGWELSRTDGTSQGTFVIGDINPGTMSQKLWGARPPGGVSDLCLFVGDNGGAAGAELWVSDGTLTGTRLVKDINPNGDGNPRFMTTLGDKVIFRATDGATGVELWVMDLKDLGAANAEPYGVGCPGTGGKVPAMGIRGKPEVPNPNFRVRMTDVVANSPLTVFLLSGSKANLPVGGGCSLLVGVPLVTLNSTGNAQGESETPIPVPNDPSIIGQSLYFSGLAIDSNGSLGNTAAVANGLRIVFGG